MVKTREWYRTHTVKAGAPHPHVGYYCAWGLRRYWGIIDKY